MDLVVPLEALIAMIWPHYSKNGSKGGRPPYPLETMLRIRMMQQWYSLSDPAMEDALIEITDAAVCGDRHGQRSAPG